MIDRCGKLKRTQNYADGHGLFGGNPCAKVDGAFRAKSFEEIDAWKEAREIVRQIYEVAKRGPFAKDFGFKDQVCRAAVSIMSIIAEESQTAGTFIRHLGIAKGSAGELRSQLYVALDQSYITKLEFDSLCDQSRKIASEIARFKTYLETKSATGH